MKKVVVDNKHYKDMCYNEIELCAQITNTILGSIVNTIGSAFVITKRQKDNSSY